MSIIKYLSLADSNYKDGGFKRENLSGTLLLTKLHSRNIFISKSKKRCAFKDFAVQKLLDNNAVEESSVLKYLSDTEKAIFEGNIVETGTIDSVIDTIHKRRLEYFDKDLFFDKTVKKPHKISGINQSEICKSALKKPVLILYLSEDLHTADLLEFLKKYKEDKKIYLLAADGDYGIIPTEEKFKEIIGDGYNPTYLKIKNCIACADLSSVQYDAALEEDIKENRVCFIGFGNDALLQAHNLNCDSVIFVNPNGMPSCAVCGTFTENVFNLIFVPKNFNIIKYVPFTEKSELTFLHLSFLCEKYGEDIYKKDITGLQKLCPELFYNIYEDHIPPVINNTFKFSGGDFKEKREEYIVNALKTVKNGEYIHSYINLDTFEEIKPDWNTSAKQNAVLVDGVLAKKGTPVSVYVHKQNVSPREFYFNSKKDGKYFITNFSFFMTGRLMSYYNSLRKDRLREQIFEETGYLDYYRFYDKSGKKHETFPLYKKMTVAFLKDGSFSAFDFSLCGGSVTLCSGEKITFKNNDVNPENPCDVAVYTPLFSAKDTGGKSLDYVLEVGQDRFNIIIVGEKITAVRNGGVLLPSMGVVLSVSTEYAKEYLKAFNSFDADGYCTDFEKEITIDIDTPENMKPEIWNNISSAYGGGIGLIKNGKPLLLENDLSEFEREGWYSPLSCQTQESDQHVIKRQPRTVLGVTKDGDFFVLVFSGRSNMSAGADYFEVSKIAKMLIKDIDCLISYDGGGSSVFGLLMDNCFSEISVPAPSDNSLFGMARQINSMLEIKIFE